jgi:UPF0716 protein FxsA
MLLKILLLFTVVPLVELALLLEIGRRIGTLPTIVLILLTGIAGALLAKRQGFGVVHRIRAEMMAGQMPGAAIVDGAIILVAGALLVTPGVLTDVFGFLCLIPVTRRYMRALLWRTITRAVRRGHTRVDVHVGSGFPPDSPPPPPPSDSPPR